MYVLLAALLAGCSSTVTKTELPENYHEDLATWKQDRDERLRAESGWVNLAGLFWLEEGLNTFGSSEENDVVFPDAAPGTIGSIFLSNSTLTFTAAPGVEVTLDSIVEDSAIVYDATDGILRVMELGRYRWFIIERAGNYGIRLRDLEHPRTKESLNLDYFDWSADWRVKAEYRPFDTPRTISIDNIVGYSFEEEFTGEFVFEVDGEEYSVWPSIGEDYAFIMFGDVTSGDESYGGGRYLVTDPPDENNEVIIDFNRAYNPPCAFTPFATCPIPPSENQLPVAVTAGEKAFHSDAH